MSGVGDASPDSSAEEVPLGVSASPTVVEAESEDKDDDDDEAAAADEIGDETGDEAGDDYMTKLVYKPNEQDQRS